MVEGDAESILRTHDDSAWFMVSGETGGQAVWIEVEFPPNMRVVELNKYTFSHGMNFANHMFPYGISDSAWFQMKVGIFYSGRERMFSDCLAVWRQPLARIWHQHTPLHITLVLGI